LIQVKLKGLQLRRKILKCNNNKEVIAQHKIKLAMVTASFSINGISTVIMNYCRNMDLNYFDITIIAGTPIDALYKTECDLNGIHMIELPSKKENPKAYYWCLWKFLTTEYDIVHVHGNSAVIAIELLLAFLRGIKIRFAHCHNTTCNHVRLHKLLKPIFNCLYTEGFACSSLAGKWLFGNREIYIIPNGFEVERFRFNEKSRKEIRQKLQIENKFLIGHVGRFNEQKNQTFILEVFEKVAEVNSNAFLILVGTGPYFEKIKLLVQKHPYQKQIIIYGETNETEKLYAAMDVFLFPSKHEGLGISLLEAQISGLYCVSSDIVPLEVLLSSEVILLSLSNDIELWKNAILSFKRKKRETFYDDYIDKIERYDILENVHYLEEIYFQSRLKIF